jgi:surfactin synthase thioesterase subunit
MAQAPIPPNIPSLPGKNRLYPRVLAFPFAGGNKYAYQPYEAHLPKDLEWLTFEGPGKAERFREARLDDMQHVLDDYWRQIGGYLREPYALYGHSFGAMAAFLLARRIRAEGLKPPVHLFLSGRVPPSWSDEGDKLWKMDKTRFWEGIKAYGGSPDALLQHPDLMALYEPMIRSDLKALDSWDHAAHPEAPLDVPATVLLGTREKITMESAPAWQQEFRPEIRIRQFEGRHFWILDHTAEVVALIAETLRPGG